MAAGKKVSDLTAATKSRSLLEAVRNWQRESKKKRISVERLAKKLCCTVGRINKALEAPRKKLRAAVEKVKIIKALRKREAALIPKDSAVKVASDLRVEYFSARTVRQMRAAYRQRAVAAKR